MKKSHAAFLMIVASLFVAGVVLPAQAPGGALKTANGIALAEFSGYEVWPLVATSQPDDAGGCGTSKTGCTKAILGNPAMLKAYQDGFPANGRAVPDGAAMAKVEWAKDRSAAQPYVVTKPGRQTEVSFMLKDSKRFAETDGWGYATFQNTESGTLTAAKPTTASGARATCHSCHTAGAKARDFVFTDYAKR
jgi:hypothetical protein